MRTAIWKNCPGILNDGEQAHAMRDHCTSCAPFWGRYPACPSCGGRLTKTGRTKCKGCGRFVTVVREEKH
jgi:hypothetical protein